MTEHSFYMERAIQLAKRGTGFTNPNPLVGAVIVKDHRIIGEGWHARYGDLHAERNALKHCTEDPAGATMYVTLEPCCHQGRQPPCTDAILEAGIAQSPEGRRVFPNLTVLENLPVICRTVDVFDKCAMIDEIIVVTQQELLEKVSRYLKAYDKMRMVVAGGETRTDSVMAGLAAVSDRAQLVAVHDGARPLVTDAVICRAVSKAKKFGAAAPAVRVKDTIKVSTDGAVEETPDRSKLYAVQTPQVFDRDLLAAALQNAKEQEIAITDDCSAVEALGMPVQLTDGDEENLKITTPLDLELAALILRRRANA